MNYVHLKTLSTSTMSIKCVYFTIWPHTGLTMPTGLLFWWDFVRIMLAIKAILPVSLKLPHLPIFRFGWFLQQYKYMCLVCNFFSSGTERRWESLSLWGQWESSLISISTFANLILKPLCFTHDFRKWRYAKYPFVKQKLNNPASCCK